MVKITLGVVQAGMILGKLFDLLDLSWFMVFIPLYIVILSAMVIVGLSCLRCWQLRRQYPSLFK